MNDTAIFTLTSPLHNKEAVAAETAEFLNALDISYDLKEDDDDIHIDYFSSMFRLNLLYVRTGGTEGIFRRWLSRWETPPEPIYLLASDKSNSLAASMEILSFLRQRGIKGEIIHGSKEYVAERIRTLSRIYAAKRKLWRSRMAIIGKPSDWLISSEADSEKVLDTLGIILKQVEISQVMDCLNIVPRDIALSEEFVARAANDTIRRNLVDAERIYHALNIIIEDGNYCGFTLRCFDLLSLVHNTGCIALAKFNSAGIVASCEGDVPAMISMRIAQAATGFIGFQANPASINPETGEMTFAHCTIPFNLVGDYELDTHYESGIGVGIRGFMPEDDVTIYKVSGDLSRQFIAEGRLIRNECRPDRCRTQQVIKLDDPAQAQYFLTNPIGNHHIVIPGRHKRVLEGIL